ncbi:Uncharacterized protein HZ326_8919 [Fusarium oxysporum f. sp. albedinis]|nr:Uncharacterized protein HZ326_8919 [Fusarium oxysporum f. sp. albedinis]
MLCYLSFSQCYYLTTHELMSLQLNMHMQSRLSHETISSALKDMFPQPSRQIHPQHLLQATHRSHPIPPS